MSGVRSGFNEKGVLLLSKARFLLLKYQIDASEIAYIIIGETLSETGRYAEALKYYHQALNVAQTQHTRALARRPLGAALIASGQLNQGREQLLAAANELSELIDKPGFEADMMRVERADALRRLLWVELQMGERAHVEEDSKALSAAILAVRDPWRRKSLEKARDELIEKGLEGVKI